MKSATLWTALFALAACAGAAGAETDFLEPSDPLVRAHAAFARGDTADAEALVAPLAGGANPRAEACALLGEIRAGQNRIPEAVALFRQAARLRPQSSGYQCRLGNALLQLLGSAPAADQGRLGAEALAALQRAIQLDPENSDAYQGLAQYYAAIPESAGGGYDKAIEAAREMKKRQVLDGAITAAVIAERLNRLEAALGFWREALQNFSGDAGLRECEPRVLAKLGRTAEARRCYQRILVDFPEDESARKALAALPPDP